MARTLTTEPFEVEIIVEGHLDLRRAEWFAGMHISREPEGVTRITGRVADQAALFALISRVRDLGLRLVSVDRS